MTHAGHYKWGYKAIHIHSSRTLILFLCNSLYSHSESYHSELWWPILQILKTRPIMIYSTTYCVPEPPGIPNSTFGDVTGTCNDLITSVEPVWDCPQQVPIPDSFVVLLDLLCNHPPCKTIVWQLGSKSVLQFVVLLSSCTYHIVLGKHPWSSQVKSCTKLEGGQVNQEVLYWFNTGPYHRREVTCREWNQPSSLLHQRFVEASSMVEKVVLC